MDHQPRSPNPIVAFLDDEASRRGLSREGMSLAAGCSRDIIRKTDERGPRAKPQIDTLKKFAAYLEMDILELMQHLPGPPEPRKPKGTRKGEVVFAGEFNLPRAGRDVPVLGTAAGAATGAFRLSSDPVDFVSRPPAMFGAKDLYGVYVENDSMYPKFSHGDLVFVHPHRPISPGDTVIVQVQTMAGAEIEAYIKTFVKRQAEWIVVSQLNPASNIQYRRDSVVAIHKVLTTAELFGL